MANTTQKIIIKAKDATGETMEFIKMSSPIMAEMVFYGLTHDDAHQDLNWYLIVDDIEINWHCPLNKAAH